MKHRAFMSIDALIGMFIVAGVTIGLLTAAHSQRQAEFLLANNRSALHLAEHALLSLQHHQPAPTLAGAKLTLQPANTGQAPPGYAWIKVTAVVAGQTQSLFGVVPLSTLAAGKSS
jgi:hypothetical protein